MPSGKVRFFDEDKGFGFITGEHGEQVYVHASVVEGDQPLYGGAKVEYSMVDGRRGPQALSARVTSAPKRVRANRKSADDMAVIVEDLVKLLDGVGGSLKNGQYPDRKHSRQIAQMLRHVADDFDV